MRESLSTSKILTKISVFGYFIGVLAAIVAGVSVFFLSDNNKVEHKRFFFVNEEAKSLMEKRIDELERKLADIIRIMKDETYKDNSFNTIDLRIREVESHIGVINNAIMQNPEKALQIPMIKKDLMILREEIDESKEWLKEEVKETNANMRWMIGTIVLSIVGIAAGYIPNFFGKPKNND